jgi:hypothetical protein
MESLVPCVAKALEKDEAAVLNMVKNAYEDVQVNFLWSLWGDASLEKRAGPKAEGATAGGGTAVPPVV